MRRALFGGSFDPFHDGHLAMIRATLERGLADLVLVMPAAQNPCKPAPGAAGEHRLRMAALGTAGLAAVEVSDFELRRPGPSYTVDTLEALARRHPGEAWRLLVGADNLEEFRAWRRPERLLELADLLVFPRGDAGVALPPALTRHATVVTGFACPAASTAVRAALAAGRGPVASVPPAVLEYIARHGLYGGATAAGRSEGAPCP
ncbi:MAG: nicotinate (nicotinamide) nucleotide adenylyltransferase [Candidatus Krumholzibacteriia bacterium]